MNRVLAKNAYKAARQVRQNKTRKLPILNHILLFQNANSLWMMSTDLTETLVSDSIPSIGADNFSTCVPMKSFIAWLRVVAAYKDVLILSFEPGIQVLTITASTDMGKSRTTFKCIDAEEFPCEENKP